jgi:hypothetical protein
MLSDAGGSGDAVWLRIGRVQIDRNAERVRLRVDTNPGRDAALMLAIGGPIGAGLVILGLVLGGSAGFRAYLIGFGVVVIAVSALIGWRLGRRAGQYELDALCAGDRAVRVRGPDGWTRVERADLEGFTVGKASGHRTRYCFPQVAFAGQTRPLTDPRASGVERPVELICAALAALVQGQGDIAAVIADVRRMRRFELAVVVALAGVVVGCGAWIAIVLA